MKNHRKAALQLLAFVLLVVLMIFVFGPRVIAQSSGYRYGPNGLILIGNGSVCFEPTYNAGVDSCIQRTGIGHLSFVNGTGATLPDMAGQVALVSGTKTITFANAYTVAPLAVCTDTNATATVVGCHTTTTTLVINGSSTDTINYEIIPNPN